jgi:magnesium transporter
MTIMIETLDLAALIHGGDFSKLHEELSHRSPQDLAGAITDLRSDDQVLAFRILPRRTAAAVFEYLSRDSQRALVNAMGQEDVAHCSIRCHRTIARGS